jgi:hypothetical protein
MDAWKTSSARRPWNQGVSSVQGWWGRDVDPARLKPGKVDGEDPSRFTLSVSRAQQAETYDCRIADDGTLAIDLRE